MLCGNTTINRYLLQKSVISADSLAVMLFSECSQVDLHNIPDCNHQHNICVLLCRHKAQLRCNPWQAVIFHFPCIPPQHFSFIYSLATSLIGPFSYQVRGRFAFRMALTLCSTNKTENYFQRVLCKPGITCTLKIPVDQLFMKYSDHPVSGTSIHQSYSYPFWCLVWTSASCFHHV